MSRDIPILFSTPMIQALLAGRKTQTRRLAVQERKTRKPALGESLTYSTPSPWCKVKAGDRLWVRETWEDSIGGEPTYRATVIEDVDGAWTAEEIADIRWRSPLHMRREYSRITLLVTDANIEPLQDISNDDCEAEGIESGVWDMCVGYRNYMFDDRWFYTWPDAFNYEGYTEPEEIQRRSFQSLWVKLHGQKSWDENPSLVAMTFKVIKANIDAPEARIAA